MSEAGQRTHVGLVHIEAELRAVAAGYGDPYVAARRIWSEAMSGAAESHDLMRPLWLLWGALTDWVEVKPEQAARAHEAMRRAADEWLALPREATSRDAYFERWLYEEMGCERPGGATAAGRSADRLGSEAAHRRMSFRGAVLRFELGLLPADELPHAAVQALEEGLDCEALRILAAHSLPPDDPSSVVTAYRRTLGDLGIVVPDRDGAVHELLEEDLAAIAAPRSHAYAEAKRTIAEIYFGLGFSGRNKEYVGDALGIEGLYGLVDTYDELVVSTRQWQAGRSNADLITELISEIRAEAVRLLEERPWRKPSTASSR